MTTPLAHSAQANELLATLDPILYGYQYRATVAGLELEYRTDVPLETRIRNSRRAAELVLLDDLEHAAAVDACIREPAWTKPGDPHWDEVMERAGAHVCDPGEATAEDGINWECSVCGKPVA